LHPPLHPWHPPHIQRALAQGATVEEIMEVLKLCGGLGVDACELGTPILSQELADQETP
jgi:alkylhydroperoxidase/carboxymuconolactone decarboxylase family protein YurZ